MATLADRIVATSNPLASQAGIQMLLEGGNAVDAALAAAITLTVVEPMSCGLGGDGTAIVADGATVLGMNATGTAPLHIDAERLTRKKRMPMFGWDTVTVPGVVSGWAGLWRRFGSLPFERLFEPAVRYARSGFPVLSGAARAWSYYGAVFGSDQEYRRTFLPEGKPPACGDRFFLPGLARTLQEIARTEGRSFYEGPTAERIVECARDADAPLSLHDLHDYQCAWVDPLAARYRGFLVHELPPSTQGVAVLLALAILEQLDETGLDESERCHREIEATKIALSDTYAEVGDQPDNRARMEDLLSDPAIRERARNIVDGRARDTGYQGLQTFGTSCVVTADANGMMVSYLQSLYTGSGIVVPGTGIHLNNRGAAFEARAGHPNAVGGGKRPLNTNIPCLITREGAPVAALGVIGGAMQAQGHVQLIRRVIDGREDGQAAMDAPRWRVERGTSISAEPDFPSAVSDRLADYGHRRVGVGQGGFGVAQMVLRGQHGLIGVSDARRDGQQALGF